MFKKTLLPMLAAAAILGSTLSASAMPKSSMMGHKMMGHGMMGHGMMGHGMMGHGIYKHMKIGPDHGMPVGTSGGDGVTYTGAPDLQAAISLVIAGGAPRNFSIVKAITALAGPAVAKAEVAKLAKQYGDARVQKFVGVQNFAVNDAVRIALAAGVKFPKPALTGGTLAKRLTGLGLVNGTYYEGTFLDHLVSNKIHEAVMVDIDRTFGKEADANYHLIANQAHYDLAQALGVTTVKLAAYH
ncbi:MAG: hypothetical protein M3Z07_04430 [Candidatus Eremiobacteraeota bacterium]|nr:hypothetical protein [Candidatus Eremiobacteraeota bacterium]